MWYLSKVPATQGKKIINCHHQNLTFLLLKTPSSEKATHKMKKKKKLYLKSWNETCSRINITTQ